MSIPVNAIRKHLEEERLHPSQLFSQLTQAQYDQLKASAQDPLSVEQGKLYVRDYKEEDGAKKEVLVATRVPQVLRQLRAQRKTLDKSQFRATALALYAIGKDQVDELYQHSELHQRGIVPRKAQNRTVIDKANPRVKELPDGSKEVQKANGPGAILGVDHLDLSTVRKASGTQYNWILTVIDVFSRYVWLFAARTKNQAETTQHLRAVRAWIRGNGGGSNWRPRVMAGDNAFELRNAATAVGWRYHASKTYTGFHLVENHNGRIRRQLGRLARSLDGASFLQWVQRMAREHNNAAHSVLKIAPARIWAGTFDRPNGGARDREMLLVAAKRNKDAAIRYMGNQSLAEYEVGDFVRISILAISSVRRSEAKSGIGTRKAYSGPNWTKALYRIESRSKGTTTSRPVYKLGGMRGQFHRNELQRVDRGKMQADEASQANLRTTAKNDPAVQLKGRALVRSPTGHPASYIGKPIVVESDDRDRKLFGKIIAYVPARGADGEPDHLRDGYVAEMGRGNQRAKRRFYFDAAELLDRLVNPETEEDSEEETEEQEPVRSSRLALKAKAAASAKSAAGRRFQQQLQRDRGFVGRTIVLRRRGQPAVKGRIIRRHETRPNHYYVQWGPPLSEVEVLPQTDWVGEQTRFTLLPAKR